MPRRRPECGAARAAGGSGPGDGRNRTGRPRPPTGAAKTPGRRSEAGRRAADARNAAQTRAARSEEGGIRTALHERAAKQETQKGPKAGRTYRREGCGKAHAAAKTLAGQGADAGTAEEPAEKHTQPQRGPQDRVRMPESQRDPQKSTRSRRGPAEAAKPARAAPCAGGGVPAKSDAVRNGNRTRATARLPPDFRPTSGRLSQGAQEPHREHRTAQTAPPEKIRARGFTASGSSVRLVRLMRVGESHVSIHKDNSGLR